jgi:copper chaperone
MTDFLKKIILHVDGMTCGGCVEAVKRVIRKVDQGSKIDIDLTSGRVEVVTIIPAEELVEAVTKAGYPAHTGD